MKQKLCDPHNPKASQSSYMCNPHTGRWIKNTTFKKTHRDQCHNALLEQFGIKVVKKFVYQAKDMMNVDPMELEREWIHFKGCYIDLSNFSESQFGLKNPKWEQVHSYQDLVNTTLLFFSIFSKTTMDKWEAHKWARLRRIFLSFYKLLQSNQLTDPLPSLSQLRRLISEFKKHLIHTDNLYKRLLPPTKVVNIIEHLFGSRLNQPAFKTLAMDFLKSSLNSEEYSRTYNRLFKS